MQIKDQTITGTDHNITLNIRNKTKIKALFFTRQ